MNRGAYAIRPLGLVNNNEWAGATLSPDGRTLFVNIKATRHLAAQATSG